MSAAPLRLNDLLRLNEDDLRRAKVKFNKHNGFEDPMEIYKSDPDIINNRWLLWHKKRRYFRPGQLAICLLRLTPDTHLLTTIKHIDQALDVSDGIGYEAHEVDRFRPLFGRVILKYRKNFQTQGVALRTIMDDMEVLQILPTAFDGDDFPGYDRVRLSFEQLATIIRRNKRDWIAALENQKSVYLITDTSNGRLYVGSATGENGMLLQRWTSYVHSGHGGNRDLKRIDFDHIKRYFQYSILENYNARISQELVLARESWWKKTLCSKAPHGYNAN